MGFLQNREAYAWSNMDGNAGFTDYISQDEFFNQGGAAQQNVQQQGLAAPQGGGLADCATFDNDCNCYYGGCTDPSKIGYQPTATCDDGSCGATTVMGCTDQSKLGFNPAANVDDGSCGAVATSGCTDPAASNYNINATTGCNWQSGPAVPSPTQQVAPPQAFSGIYSNAAGRGMNRGSDVTVNGQRVAGPRGPQRGPSTGLYHLCKLLGCQEGYRCTWGGCEWIERDRF